MAQESKVKVTLTLELDKSIYEQFRSIFDETTLTEFASNILDDTLPQIEQDTENLAYWLEKQSKRLMEGKKA